MEMQCSHCSEPLLAGTTGTFCCAGCERASLLQSAALNLAAAESGRWEERYRYLDQNPSRTLEFYVEGLSCPSCVRTLEALSDFDSAVIASRLDWGKSTLTITLGVEGKWSKTIGTLEKLGYRASPLASPTDQALAHKSEWRRDLIRLAVAGTCSANIMLASISLYAGADGGLATLFRWTIFALAIPSVFYCAWPFYQSTIAAVRGGRLSIDLPVSAAILIGFFSACNQIYHGTNQIYLDSLTALIFLLLSSRFFLKRLQEKAMSLSDVMNSWLPNTDARVGDEIWVESTDLIPVDGYLMTTPAWIDTSVVTGESVPQVHAVGSKLLAGMVNLSERIQIRVSAVGSDREVARNLLNVDRFQLNRSKTIGIADRWAQYFLAVILLIAGGVIAWFWKSDVTTGLSRALTLAVVACPCALALATPLTYIQGYRAALRLGLILKNVSVLDRLLDVKTICFDKTGTLTHGRLQVVGTQIVGAADANWKSIVFALEKPSKHPVARAVALEMSESKDTTICVHDWKEIPGHGVSGYVENELWEIKRESGTPKLGVFKNGKILVTLQLEDQLRSEALDVVRQVRDLGLGVRLLSGDHARPALQIGAEAGFHESEIFPELSPEEKVTRSHGCMVVGDGLNDAPALAGAQVGFAVRGALETNLRVADVVSTREGLSQLPELILLSRRVRGTLLLTYGFSGLYNAVGAALAVLGMIGPLGAAVLMPASSLTVFLTTFLIGRKKA